MKKLFMAVSTSTLASITKVSRRFVWHSEEHLIKCKSGRKPSKWKWFDQMNLLPGDRPMVQAREYGVDTAAEEEDSVLLCGKCRSLLRLNFPLRAVRELTTGYFALHVAVNPLVHQKSQILVHKCFQRISGHLSLE